MKINPEEIKMLLKKRVLIILFFLITFFGFNLQIKAAYFNYADFDFDEFAEENKTYWTGQCITEVDENAQEKCIELVISKQRNYYTRLYKLLAKYEKKGYFIDDNILIITTFYELDPDLFTDKGEDYKKVIDKDESAYNYDPNLNLDYDVDEEPNLDYFENEKDTIDLLIRNMLGYVSKCHGIYGEVVEVQNEDGTYEPNCPSGGYPTVVDGDYVCASTADSSIVGFWEYMAHKSGANSFFGLKNEHKKHCEALAASYLGGTKYEMETGKKYSPETLKKYWEFLETSTYFDNKAHLRHFFQTILEETNHTRMKDLSNSEREKYSEELIVIRKKIVANIKSILEIRGVKVDAVKLSSISNSEYWWPIGGSEITTNGEGNQYAVGLPASMTISSQYGKRVDPITGKEDTFHTGIDISGPVGTNIIAVRSGIVETVVDECLSGGDASCGGGYGNYVVISHADGNYTLYAHLHENSITVKKGESVEQGQFIGEMGSSGRSTGSHLHFEVRVGSNSSESTMNPLNYVSADPEKSRIVSNTKEEFAQMLTCLEGKGPDDGGSNYIVYNDAYGGNNIVLNRPLGAYGTLTVGPGVTLKWQQNKFAKYDLDVMSSSYYYEGALIPKNIVDQVYVDIITANSDSINSVLSLNGISLNQAQIDALALFMYNNGSIKDFVDQYNKYGNSENLNINFFSKYTAALGSSSTLVGRRSAEWDLFNLGEYRTC